MDVQQVVLGVVLVTFMVTGSKAQIDVCGTAPLTSRIVGGGDASPGEWPWQVSLHVNNTFNCGGTLINNQWVLTAAQCVDGYPASSMQVYLGRLALESPDSNEIIRNVSRAIKHPVYFSILAANDIALLELDSPVTFTNYIRPVCLAAEGSEFIPGTECWITGWGDTNTNVNLPSPKTLQKVNVDVISNDMCQKIYSVVNCYHICAGSHGKGICLGDGGGPLLTKHGDKWVQAGVMSFKSINGCGVPNFPDGYTRVSNYQSWILSQITTNSPGFVPAGTSQLVSFSVPLLVAVSLFLFLFQF